MKYEDIVRSVSDTLTEGLPDDIVRKVIVDIPTVGMSDLYSNAPKICGENFHMPREIPYVENFFQDAGFINIRLNINVFEEFLSEFGIGEFKGISETEKRLEAYIMLAENEKNFPENETVSMNFTPEVRRVLIYIMKGLYFSDKDLRKARISCEKALRITENLRPTCMNLKIFAITYEPLLIAVTAFLSKLRSKGEPF